MRLFGRSAPPLPDDIQVLLASERSIVPQPEEVRARMIARARAASQHGAMTGGSPAQRGFRLRRVALAAATGVILAAGIASAYRVMVRPELPPASPGPSPEPRRGRGTSGDLASRPPEAAPTAAPQGAPAAVPTEVTGGEAARNASARPAALARRARPDDDLRELRLLDRARQADTRGEHDSVLAVVAEHERDFPAGRLIEEREVMRVKALVSLGRDGDARRAVARFHRQFPHSVLSRRLDDMLVITP